MKKKNLLLTVVMACLAITGFGQTWQIGSPNEADVTATLTDGTLVISGKGNTKNFDDIVKSKQIISVIIEDGVTSIGDWLFSGCSALESVTIPLSVIKIGDWAFFGCESITSITIPGSVMSIGSDAFAASGLTSITIPNGDIGGYAFEACENLTSVTLGSGVTSIGYMAFVDCISLEDIIVLWDTPEGVSTDDSFYSLEKSAITLHVPSGAKSAYLASDDWKDFNIVENNDIVEKMDVIVMKGDAVVFQSAVSAIDSVIFYNPANSTVTPSNDALFIYKAEDTSYDKLLLSDIRKLSFLDVDLSIEKWNVESLLYAFNDIQKLSFGEISTNTSISYPGQDKPEVVAYFTKAGDLVVESPVGVKSLSLFSIDGKIITTRNAPTGIYIVRIETPQGVFVKKLIKQ